MMDKFCKICGGHFKAEPTEKQARRNVPSCKTICSDECRKEANRRKVKAYVLRNKELVAKRKKVYRSQPKNKAHERVMKKEYDKKNPHRKAAWDLKYRSSEKGKLRKKINGIAYRQRPEIIKRRKKVKQSPVAKRYQRHYVESLQDGYICGLLKDSIPTEYRNQVHPQKEQIKERRELVKLKREINEKQRRHINASGNHG